jgi:gluconate 2-dehydrogenase gamma chain
MVKVLLDRRRFLISGVVAGVAGAVPAAPIRDGELGAPSRTVNGRLPWAENAADVPPMVTGTDFTFFTPVELTLVNALVARLIPNDELGPGGVEANVPFFLDRQLSGPFGRGDHYYLGGPWPKGTPEQGYQSRFSPAALYRAALAAIDRYVAQNHAGATFATLAPDDQVALLKGMESGDVQLDGVDSKVFFATLLQNCKEGYFGDPIYGGNKDMGAWKMIGFPGAHYDYREWVTRHNERVPLEPVSLMGRPGWRQA